MTAPLETPANSPEAATSAVTPAGTAPSAIEAASALPAHPGLIPPAVLWSQRLAVASLLGLIALCLAWELWLAPLRPGGSWLALKALPLCIPLAGLLRMRLYTFRWVSLVVWLYFIEGVVRAWSDRPPSSWLAGLEIALCLSLFTGVVLHVRLRLAAAKKAAAAAASDAAAA